MDKAGVGPKDIDMLVYATLSPDNNFPGTGVFVQRLLGLREVPCYDIRQQCTGFLYGLAMADAFIKSGQYKTILVIGSEVHSTGLDMATTGRDVTVLFGDGAGAVVMTRATDDQHVLLSTHLHADGTDAEILWTEYPASRQHPRITEEAMAARKHFPAIQGKKVFKHAVTRMPAAIMEGMVTNNLKLTDIDMVIPHQANLRINQMVAKMIGLPEDRMHNNIQKYGNTTAASIPICMHEAVEGPGLAGSFFSTDAWVRNGTNVDDLPIAQITPYLARTAEAFSVDHRQGCGTCDLRNLCGGTCR